MEQQTVIKIENVGKVYKLGQIGGGTLTAEIQSKWAKLRGKEDPNLKLGEKSYIKGEKLYALDGINLEVKEGEAVGIIGHNGAGKSTLLKLLCRVTSPSEGTIKIKGRIASMLEVGTGFHAELTGRENIYMNGAILGMTRKEVDKKIDDIIEFSECGDFIDTPVKRYSSGMYVKLAFAVAAHLDADIMIMDEVLAVGDVKFQKKCLGKMGDAAGNEGKTVLYVSHNMNTIRQLCTRCIVLSHGTVIFDGDVEEAINYYMEIASSEKKSFWDFSDAKRPNFDFGKNFRIMSVKFRGNEENIFETGEPIRFDVAWKSKIEIENVFLRFEVQNMDSTPVGMAESTMVKKVGAHEEGVWTFCWDASNIVEGEYQIAMDVYTSNEYGAYYSFDHPSQSMIISIVDSKTKERKSNWDRKYWNSVRLNTIVLEARQ